MSARDFATCCAAGRRQAANAQLERRRRQNQPPNVSKASSTKDRDQSAGTMLGFCGGTGTRSPR